MANNLSVNMSMVLASLVLPVTFMVMVGSVTIRCIRLLVGRVLDKSASRSELFRENTSVFLGRFFPRKQNSKMSEFGPKCGGNIAKV